MNGVAALAGIRSRAPSADSISRRARVRQRHRLTLPSNAGSCTGSRLRGARAPPSTAPTGLTPGTSGTAFSIAVPRARARSAPRTAAIASTVRGERVASPSRVEPLPTVIGLRNSPARAQPTDRRPARPVGSTYSRPFRDRPSGGRPLADRNTCARFADARREALRRSPRRTRCSGAMVFRPSSVERHGRRPRARLGFRCELELGEPLVAAGAEPTTTLDGTCGKIYGDVARDRELPRLVHVTGRRWSDDLVHALDVTRDTRSPCAPPSAPTLFDAEQPAARATSPSPPRCADDETAGTPRPAPATAHMTSGEN